MPDVTLELDLVDAKVLQRLAEIGAAHKTGAGIPNPDDDRVLQFLAMRIALAEKSSRELAVFGPPTEVKS